MPRTKTTTKKTTKASAKKVKEKVTKPKKVKVKEAKEVKKEEKVVKEERYIEAVGRRKTAIARVRIWTKGTKEIIVNDKPYTEYFPTIDLHKTVIAPLELLKITDKFRIVVKVKGGGVRAQAEAIRHGLARVLVKLNPDFKKRLKRAGFLTRDPREKERKKFGLKRARRAPQWSKR
ncbi:30S ribosomal protein S9 [bacterium]|nr:30S ribosomal protein S9 [bacterium]